MIRARKSVRTESGAAMVEYVMLLTTFCALIISVAPSTIAGVNGSLAQFNSALSPVNASLIIHPTAHPLSPPDGEIHGGGTDGTVGSCDEIGYVWNPATHRCEEIS